MTEHAVLPHEEWVQARRAFFAREKGRDEPADDPQFWVRRHDEYGR